MIHCGQTWFIPFELSSLKGSSTKWAVCVETIIFHDCIVQDKEGKKGTQKSIMHCGLADHWLCLFKIVVILKTFIHRLKLVCWKIHIFLCMQSACQGWFIVKIVKQILLEFFPFPILLQQPPCCHCHNLFLSNNFASACQSTTIAKSTI